MCEYNFGFLRAIYLRQDDKNICKMKIRFKSCKLALRAVGENAAIREREKKRGIKGPGGLFLSWNILRAVSDSYILREARFHDRRFSHVMFSDTTQCLSWLAILISRRA